jgi:hypothetical protein
LPRAGEGVEPAWHSEPKSTPPVACDAVWAAQQPTKHVATMCPRREPLLAMEQRMTMLLKLKLRRLAYWLSELSELGELDAQRASVGEQLHSPRCPSISVS